MNTVERKKNQISSQTKRPVVKGLRRDSVLLEGNSTRIRKETRSTRLVLKPTTHKPKPAVVDSSRSAINPVVSSTDDKDEEQQVVNENKPAIYPVVSSTDYKDEEQQVVNENTPVINPVVSSTDYKDEEQQVVNDNKPNGFEEDYSGSDSTSSQGDYLTADDDDEEESGKVSKKLVKKKHLRRERDDKAAASIIKCSIPNFVINFDEHATVSVKDRCNMLPSSESCDNICSESTSAEDKDECQSIVKGADGVKVNEKIEQMGKRIDKLEDELCQVAAIETCLYSVVPQHGNSSSELHKPARVLCRLYIHACEHWSRSKRASVARNIVSGFIMVARTSGDDVPRLTYWLSNIVVLREMVQQQAVGLKIDGLVGDRSSIESIEVWQKTRTLTACLERIESWMFLRIMDSIWKQTFCSYMQSPVGSEALGSFSTNWWISAFRDALQRLCPIRARGSECGCLPVLARMTMDECIDRVDVAMFNAILRESAHQVPTDPISDPIADQKVLPIPAGELTFGSGAQLKNSVGNWCRWLTECLDVETDVGPPICFPLLDELSDLLMTPKDMLLDHSVRLEICPSITLPLIKRVLCNFCPDEFCPDHVPVELLETLNAEVIAGESGCSFPYTANPVTYTPPSSAYVAELAAEIMDPLTQDYHMCDDYDDLKNDLTSPLLTSLVEDTFPCTSKSTGVTGNSNTRHQLLHQLWSV